MPTGRPDWYDQVVLVGTDVIVPISIQGATVNVPITIKGSEVTLDVNIKSSVTIDVNIASQSVTIDVNIKSSEITLNVQITGSTVTLDVNIKSQEVTLNVNIESVGSDVVFNVNIKSQSVDIGVVIKSSDVTLDVNVINSVLNVNVGTFPFENASENILENPGFETGDLNGWGYYGDGDVTIDSAKKYDGSYSAKIYAPANGYTILYSKTSIPVQPGQKLMATGWIYADENVSSVEIRFALSPPEGTPKKWLKQKLTPTANTWTSFKFVIEVPEGYCRAGLQIRVNAGSADAYCWVDSLFIPRYVILGANTEIPININIASQSVTMDVNIKAQEVDLNVVIKGTANVNIANAEVYLNVQNEEYKESRRVLQNNGTAYSSYYLTELRGKYFPHGARGFIEKIELRCKNTDTEDHTVTFYLCIAPGYPPIWQGSVTIPAGFDDWLAITPKIWWAYDSILVVAIADSNDVLFMYDTGAPYDAWYFGTNWSEYTPVNARYWFKITIYGQTTGDIPVSGTVNTIQIPNTAASSGKISYTIKAGETQIIKVVEGMGRMLFLHFVCNSEYVRVGILADGVEAWTTDFGPVQMYEWYGYGQQGGPITVAKTTVDSTTLYILKWAVPISFRKKLEIKIYFPAPAGATAEGHFIVVYEVIK